MKRVNHCTGWSSVPFQRLQCRLQCHISSCVANKLQATIGSLRILRPSKDTILWRALWLSAAVEFWELRKRAKAAAKRSKAPKDRTAIVLATRDDEEVIRGHPMNAVTKKRTFAFAQSRISNYKITKRAFIFLAIFVNELLVRGR